MEGSESFTLQIKVNKETVLSNVAPKVTRDFCLIPLFAAFYLKSGERRRHAS